METFVRQKSIRFSAITAELERIPHGPDEKYDPSHDLLNWLSDQFRQFGDIYKANIYGTNVYVVSNPQYAHHVLQENWQNYQKGQAIKRIGFLLGNGLMVSEGEFWKNQRRMIQPAFHHEAVGMLANVITAANMELLKKWEHAAQEKRDVNVTRDISIMVLQIVLISIFGDAYDQVAPHFKILSEESARNLQFAQAFRPLGRLVVQIAAERRKQNVVRTDILGMLMEARARESGEPMSDHQLVSEIITLVVAGYETTASTLNLTWYLLSQHPEVVRKLSNELTNLPRGEFPQLSDLPKFTYTRQILEETMRLYPPGWLMTRKAIKKDWLGDYNVPAGTEIYISPYLIQRHPSLWETPDRFNPDRFDPSHSKDRHPLAMLPFSAGPRKCIGESLARIEMQIHLMIIGKHLQLQHVDGEALELEAGVNLRSKHDFIMTPEIKVTNSSRRS